MPELRLPAACLTTPEEEEAFFAQMPPVTMAYPDIYEYAIVVEDPLLTEDTLLTLLGLFRRYHAPMGQFAAFETPENHPWFRDPQAWWYEAVFSTADSDAGTPAVH